MKGILKFARQMPICQLGGEEMTTNVARDHPAIHVRSPKLDFNSSTPRYWFADNPFLTHSLNALSCTFPGGERFFTDAVRHYLPMLKDPVLRTQVRGFLAQESKHQQEHEDFNHWVTSLGMGADEMAAEMEATLRRRQRYASPLQRLAVTCSLEHYTAMMAECLLNWPAFLEMMHPSVRALWIWHAMEEIEHKSVAFDVYQEVGGGYWRRIWAMLVSTYRIMTITVKYSTLMAIKDGKLFTTRGRLQALWLMVGPFGFLSRTLPEYLRYFSPKFTPWGKDNRELIARWSAKIEQFQLSEQGAKPRAWSAGKDDLENDSQLHYDKVG